MLRRLSRIGTGKPDKRIVQMIEIPVHHRNVCRNTGPGAGQVAFNVEVVGMSIVIRIEHVVPDIEWMAVCNRVIDINRLSDIPGKQLSGAQMPPTATAARIRLPDFVIAEE